MKTRSEKTMKWLSLMNQQLKRGVITKQQFKKEIKTMKKIGITIMALVLLGLGSCSKEKIDQSPSKNPRCGIIVGIEGGPSHTTSSYLNGQLTYFTTPGSNYVLKIKMNGSNIVNEVDLGCSTCQLPTTDQVGQYYCQ